MRYPQIVIDQLAKDIPFSWFLFDHAKSNARYYFSDFFAHRQRLESYLDSMGLALAEGQKVKDWLDMDDWGSCFVMAVLGIRYQRLDLFALALDSLKERQETHYREVVDACLWHEPSDIDKYLDLMRQHSSPIAQQSYLAVLRAGRGDLDKHPINQFFLHSHTAVKIQLLHWIGEQGAQQYIAYVQQNYIDPKTPEDYELSFAAIRAGLLLKDSVARAQLIELVFSHNPVALKAVTLLMTLETYQPSLRDYVDRLWASDEITQRVKLYGTAIAGFSDYMENIIDAMAEEKLTRAAGEAFTLLCGIDIEEKQLDDEDPECTDCILAQMDKEQEEQEAEPSPEEKREKPFISAWEDELPYPDADACYQWWQENQSQFTQDTRYLAGLEITEDNLQQVMKDGNQRQRQLASMHLSLHHGYQWKDPNWP